MSEIRHWSGIHTFCLWAHNPFCRDRECERNVQQEKCKVKSGWFHQ